MITPVENLSKKDIQFLNVAVKLAETSLAKQRHGALLVRGGSVLGMGVNKFKNHPLVIGGREGCGEHAEVAAIRRVRYTEGATMYVARVLRDGTAGLSRPCSDCEKAIKDAGIKKVVWT